MSSAKHAPRDGGTDRSPVPSPGVPEPPVPTPADVAPFSVDWELPAHEVTAG